MYHIGLTCKEIEHLQSVIARLDAKVPADYSDRRLHPRIDFAQPMWLSLPTSQNQAWIHIYSRNLSTGGLSFLTRHIFHADQHVIVSHELNELTPVLALARVCFCRTIDLGVQEVGLAFVKMRADPGRSRNIPEEWLSIVLQNDGLAGYKLHPTAL